MASSSALWQSGTPRYNQLKATATEFINSSVFDSATKSVDKERVRAIRTPDFVHGFGHKFAIKGTPLAQKLDTEGFLSHVSKMAPNLASLRAEINDILIDEHRKAATLQVTYWIKPEGADETIENEMIWCLKFDEEGKKVKEGIEYLDVIASRRIKELTDISKEGK